MILIFQLAYCRNLTESGDCFHLDKSAECEAEIARPAFPKMKKL